MLLAIDAGNTNVKFALVDDCGEIVQRWRIATDARRTADEYAVWLDQLIRMAGHQRSDIAAVIIATVVPRALHNLQMLASRYFNCEAFIAGRDQVGWGIQLKVAEPQSVGAGPRRW
jgi:type III pantothenate kinase